LNTAVEMYQSTHEFGSSGLHRQLTTKLDRLS
jgi:hypothetical protein